MSSDIDISQMSECKQGVCQLINWTSQAAWRLNCTVLNPHHTHTGLIMHQNWAFCHWSASLWGVWLFIF